MFTMWRSPLKLNLQCFLHLAVEFPIFHFYDLSHSNLFLQLWAWFEMPDKSHFLSVMDFWCCSRRIETFKEVSPTYLLAHLQFTMQTPGRLFLGSLLLFLAVRMVFKFIELLKIATQFHTILNEQDPHIQYIMEQKTLKFH